jgi:ER membrane protein complex subunit 1
LGSDQEIVNVKT